MNPRKTNPKNDRTKREYLVWLREARQRSLATAEQSRHSIDRYECYTGYKEFGSFNREQALGFKFDLLNAPLKDGGPRRSIATANHILKAVRDFFAWLHSQSGYKRKFKATDIAYLNLSLGEERQARSSAPKRYASVEDYRRVLFSMPSESEIERRDRALIALLLLTGMRDAAAISLKLGHLNLEHQWIFQNPREIPTKFRKAISTDFYPVGEEVLCILVDWVAFLTSEKGFGPQDPLFPKTVVTISKGRPCSQLGRTPWSNTTPVRQIFKSAFARVELPYFNPHSIRNTLTQLAYSMRLPPETLKAWSVNMGHDSPLTTLNSYGHLTRERQAELIRSLWRSPSNEPDDDLADKIAEKIALRLGKT